MWEGVLAAAAALAILWLSWLRAHLAWAALLRLGAVAVAAGAAGSAIAGAGYHWALRRELLARGSLPRRWYLDPTALHRRLAAAQRPRVLPWFFAGGACFALTMLGCAVLLMAALADG